MNLLEKDIPHQFLSIFGLIILTIFIPILLYAVYQSASLLTRASGVKANIVIDAAIPAGSTPSYSPPIQQNNDKKTVFSFMNQLDGYRLPVGGNGSWIQAFASRTDNTISVLLTNSDVEGTHTETVPVTITGLALGEYESRLQYLVHTSCGIDDPPLDKPARTVTLEQSKFAILVCLPPQNAAIWKMKKIPKN